MKALQQAKEMEKEQICDAYYYGIDVDSNVKSPYQAAEQYYKETFNALHLTEVGDYEAQNFKLK